MEHYNLSISVLIIKQSLPAPPGRPEGGCYKQHLPDPMILSITNVTNTSAVQPTYGSPLQSLYTSTCCCCLRHASTHQRLTVDCEQQGRISARRWLSPWQQDCSADAFASSPAWADKTKYYINSDTNSRRKHTPTMDDLVAGIYSLQATPVKIIYSNCSLQPRQMM